MVNDFQFTECNAWFPRRPHVTDPSLLLGGAGLSWLGQADNVPRWFDITYLPNNVDSTISAFGNPMVWWIGFAAVLAVNRHSGHYKSGNHTTYSIKESCRKRS